MRTGSRRAAAGAWRSRRSRASPLGQYPFRAPPRPVTPLPLEIEARRSYKVHKIAEPMMPNRCLPLGSNTSRAPGRPPVTGTTSQRPWISQDPPRSPVAGVDEEHAARRQHPPHLGQGSRRVPQVSEQVDAEAGIEAAACERKGTGGIGTLHV